MTTILSPASRGAASGGFKIDPSRGERNACASSEWFSRPDDERYLLFFRELAEEVRIIRVLHGARDMPQIFDS